MSSEPRPEGAVRKTLRFFAPLLAATVGAFIAFALSWWLAAPRELVLFLGFLLIACLWPGPLVWFAIRAFALKGRIPLLWAPEDSPEEMHLSRFSPQAWARAVCKTDKPAEKSGFTGTVYVGLNLQREETEVPGQTEPVERWTFDGTWAGGLDPWKHEVMNSALVSTWQTLIPKAKDAAKAEGAAAGEALEMELDQVASIMAGIEEDVMYAEDAADFASLFDVDDLPDGAVNTEMFADGDDESRTSQQVVHEDAQAATAPDGGEPDA